MGCTTPHPFGPMVPAAKALVRLGTSSGQLEGTRRRISHRFVFRAITFTRTDLFLQCSHVKFCVKQQIMEIILVPITLVAAYLECSIQSWAHHYQAKIEKPETIQRAAKMILELKRLIYEER